MNASRARVQEIADQIAEAVGDDEGSTSRELAGLRELGVLHRPTYRLVSPYGSDLRRAVEVR